VTYLLSLVSFFFVTLLATVSRTPWYEYKEEDEQFVIHIYEMQAQTIFYNNFLNTQKNMNNELQQCRFSVYVRASSSTIPMFQRRLGVLQNLGTPYRLGDKAAGSPR
jgi:hypothetical protein